MQRFALTAIALALAVACDSSDTDKSTDSDPTETEATSDSESEVEANPCEPADTTTIYTGGIYGMVSDENGDPVGCMRAQLCIELCTVGDTSGAGSYAISTSESGNGGLELFPLSDDYADYATIGMPMPVTEGVDMEIDFTMVPYDGFTTIPATAEDVSLSGGITLNIGEDIAQTAIGYSSDTLAAVMVPEAAWPQVEGITGTVRGAWYFSPFDTQSESGMVVTIEDWGELDTASTYTVYEFAIEVGDYHWADVGEISYADGAWTGATLNHLGTMLIVEETDDT